MGGTRQGTHERSSLSDVQSKSNEDQNTGTALRTRTPASDEQKRDGGVDRLRVPPRTDTFCVCFSLSVRQQLLQRET